MGTSIDSQYRVQSQIWTQPLDNDSAIQNDGEYNTISTSNSNATQAQAYTPVIFNTPEQVSTVIISEIDQQMLKDHDLDSVELEFAVANMSTTVAAAVHENRINPPQNEEEAIARVSKVATNLQVSFGEILAILAELVEGMGALSPELKETLKMLEQLSKDKFDIAKIINQLRRDLKEVVNTAIAKEQQERRENAVKSQWWIVAAAGLGFLCALAGVFTAGSSIALGVAVISSMVAGFMLCDEVSKLKYKIIDRDAGNDFHADIINGGMLTQLFGVDPSTAIKFKETLGWVTIAMSVASLGGGVNMLRGAVKDGSKMLGVAMVITMGIAVLNLMQDISSKVGVLTHDDDMAKGGILWNEKYSHLGDIFEHLHMDPEIVRMVLGPLSMGVSMAVGAKCGFPKKWETDDRFKDVVSMRNNLAQFEMSTTKLNAFVNLLGIGSQYHEVKQADLQNNIQALLLDKESGSTKLGADQESVEIILQNLLKQFQEIMKQITDSIQDLEQQIKQAIEQFDKDMVRH